MTIVNKNSAAIIRRDSSTVDARLVRLYGEEKLSINADCSNFQAENLKSTKYNSIKQYRSPTKQ